MLLVGYGAGISLSGNLGDGVSKNALLVGIAVLLIVYRRPIRELVTALISRVGYGTVDIHIGPVQFKVDESAAAEFGNIALPFLRPLDPPSTAKEFDGKIVIDPEKKLGVTRGPAKAWIRTHASDGQDLQRALDDLIATCQARGDVRGKLAAYARQLQRCRFHGVDWLLKLRKREPALDQILTNLAAKVTARLEAPSLDELIIVHGLAAGLTLNGEWNAGRVLLEGVVQTYWPVADLLITCQYNDQVAPTVDLPAETLIDAHKTWRDRASQLRTTCEDLPEADWNSRFGGCIDQRFIVRELYKVLGSATDLVADNLPTTQVTDITKLRDAAGTDLAWCVRNPEAGACEFLDHNNLASHYQQRGTFDRSCFARAHRELDLAFQSVPPGDVEPLLYETRAEVFHAEGQPWRAVAVLLECRDIVEVLRRPTARIEGFDCASYLEGQIFAAKLVATQPEPQLALVVDILTRARTVLDDEAWPPGSEDGVELTAKLTQLLGTAEFGRANYPQAAAAFAALAATPSFRAEDRWQWMIALARARVSRARQLRRRGSEAEAGGERSNAANDLLKLDAQTRGDPNSWSIGAARDVRSKGLRVRLVFAALIANHELAEEFFQAGNEPDAAEALVRVRALLTTLAGFLALDEAQVALGNDFVKLRTDHRRYDLLCEFMLGRLEIRRDPDDLGSVRGHLAKARDSDDARLQAMIQLELGSFLLGRALRKRDRALYDEALGLLDRATVCDEALLRADAARLASTARAYPVPAARKSSAG